MAQETIFDFSAPSAAHVAMGPQVNLGDVQFELMPTLINMVQANPCCGKSHEHANAHLQHFMEVCGTIPIKGVTSDTIVFAFSCSPYLGRRSNGSMLILKMSPPGVPMHSSRNSSRQAKPMLFVERFQASNNKQMRWDYSWSLGTSPGLHLGMSSHKVSTMG